jgi:hypothetical protein
MVMANIVEYSDFISVDDNSVVPSILKNDCELSLRPIQKGCPLKCIDIAGLEKIAPLIYSLDIPINISFPPGISTVEEAKAFVVQAFTSVCDFDAYILKHQCDARSDNRNLFVSLIEIAGVLENGHCETCWRVLGFSSHYEDAVILGIDNLLYFNISTKINAIGH